MAVQGCLHGMYIKQSNAVFCNIHLVGVCITLVEFVWILVSQGVRSLKKNFEVYEKVLWTGKRSTEFSPATWLWKGNSVEIKHYKGAKKNFNLGGIWIHDLLYDS